MDQITLFSLPALTWDITESWTFLDAHGNPTGEQPITSRPWIKECTHASDECTGCANPIGYLLVSEMMHRPRDEEDDTAAAEATPATNGATVLAVE